MRSGRLVLLLLSSVLFCGVAIVRAEVPAGSRLAAISFHPYAGGEVSSLAPDGSDPFRIAGGPEARGPSPIMGARPSWSADGSRIAFLGTGGDVVLSAVFTVSADGSDPNVVPLSRRLSIWGDPVIAPDGRSVAVMRIEPIGKPFKRPFPRDRGSDRPRVNARTAIWLLGADDSRMQPLTPWSPGTLLEPSSFSPDGLRLAATEWRGEGATGRAISIDLANRRTKVLARNAVEPAYATDGSVAMVRHRHGEKWRLEELAIRSSTLLVLPAGGGRPRPLVRVRGGLRWPSWDPSGQRIAFTRLRRASRESPIPGPNSIAEINADGTCLTTVAKLTQGSFAGLAWQPGPGREAGRIVC